MRTSFVMFIALVLIGTACTKAPQQSADREVSRMAYVRVVNATPGGSAVDIFSGDQKVFNEVKPNTVIPYREIPRGLTTFRARWAGHEKDSPLAENIEILGHKEYSTLLLLPSGDEKTVDMTVFDDHEWAPSVGKAKVRVVPAVPKMSDIDVYSQGKRILGGVDFKDESRYVETDPITGDLELKRDDNQQTVATVSSLRLEPNKAYSILLVGNKDKPRTIVLEDRVEEKPPMPTGFPAS